MDDYTYIPESETSTIQTIQEPITQFSTSLNDLDRYEKAVDPDLQYKNEDLYDKTQLELRNSQYTNYVIKDEVIPNMFSDIQATVPRLNNTKSIIKPEKKQFSLNMFLSKLANSYIDILNDIINGHITMGTFTEGSRLLSLAILMVLISIFFIFFQKID